MSLTDRARALATAFPEQFTVQYPPRRAYFQERFRAPVPRTAFHDAGLLYVHVPFCERRCAYCNFSIDVRDDDARKARYVEGLVRALERLPASVGRDGIDLGGGTPTSLPTPALSRLLDALASRLRSDSPSAFSAETTPAIAGERPEVLAALVDGGVRRLSIGLQSTQPAQLGSMRRDRRVELHARALVQARAAGFSRVAVDLIFGLPGQTVEAFAADLDATVALGPDAVTTYDCLYRGKGRGLRAHAAPPPETYAAFYDLAHARLGAAGFHAPYGSLNFSRHPDETGTSAYFERRVRDGDAYLGLGDYASSHLGRSWAFSTRGVDAWLASPEAHADAYVLPDDEVMAKHLLLTLSYGRIDRARFARRFGEPIEARFADALGRAVTDGLLLSDADGFSMKSFEGAARLRALFHPERAIAWLEERASRMLTGWSTRTSSASGVDSGPLPTVTSASFASSSRTT